MSVYVNPGSQDNLVEENKEATRLQGETEDRTATAVFTERHLADLLPSVVEGLKEAGFVIDDIKVGNVLTPCAINNE
jgi:hypothetical protein